MSQMNSTEVCIFWFRRDLRSNDNTGLFHALRSGWPVVPVFIFDTNILQELPSGDRRMPLIYEALQKLDDTFRKSGSGLVTIQGTPMEAFQNLCQQYSVKAVYTNHDYEPYARKRDSAIETFLKEQGISFHSFKDQVMFEKDEVLKPDGTPYTVFTPYSKKWKDAWQQVHWKNTDSENYLHHLLQVPDPPDLVPLATLGFHARNNLPLPRLDASFLSRYHETRDYPAIEGTTHLSVSLRLGLLSIRHLLKTIQPINTKLFDELIWREFYQSILWHFPHVVHQSFKPDYDRIQWLNREEDLQAWYEGRTGYPMVDAGMRELKETGWMHNRVRMVCASFLCKHLLCDWRLGEAWFAACLLDYDLASNNGGWQWAAGCGVDAAPYFRIFNPTLQALKFDPERKYLLRYIPELDSLHYPNPIVEHEMARERCLSVYKKAIHSIP